MSEINKMIKAISLKIERRPAVLERIGLSRSTLHSRIQKGLWCPPISLGARAVGFLEHETDELIASRAADLIKRFKAAGYTKWPDGRKLSDVIKQEGTEW